MPYDSPKTIRRRQNAAENKAARPRRQRSPAQPSDDEHWNRSCDFHVKCVNAQAEAGHHDAVYRHARALIQLAVYRRAFQIMREMNLRDYWKATAMARVELYGVEASNDTT